jgi:choline-glycine betaine transporter
VSDQVLIEIGKQAPWAVVLLVVFFVFLKHMRETETARMAHEEKLETQRIAAAKERETERRAQESNNNNMWANNIKTITERWEQTTKTIAEALAEHERASRERYDKMRVTQDLLDAAKENLTRKR